VTPVSRNYNKKARTFSLTQKQVVIVWSVAVLVSAIFIYVGLLSPYIVNKNYDKRKKATWNFANEMVKVPGFAEKVAPEIFAALVQPAVEKEAEISREQRNDPNARTSYIIGAVLPILIIGGTAFVTAGPRNTKEPVDNHGRN
jgi:hypothetical protein